MQINDHARLEAIEGAVIINLEDGTSGAVTPRLARQIMANIGVLADIAEDPKNERPLPTPVLFGSKANIVN